MKSTKNRKLILRLLNENIFDCGGCPPYSASSLHYALHNNRYAELYAEQDNVPPPANEPPSIQQIHRTLKDLATEGVITCEYRLDVPYGKGLPQKVAYWQLTDRIEFNALVSSCNKAYDKTKRAKFGINFFGAIIDQGLPENEVETLKADIKALMQRTHPDKAPGLIDQFKQLQAALQWIREGIDAPTETNNQARAIAQA
jgi:hypothetical protein